MRRGVTCPKCRREISLEDINVSTDIALCRTCNRTWSYAELHAESQEPAFDPTRPPRGAWFRQNPPRGFEVGASTRSAGAFILVPFMCVWSGFSLGGIYGSQIAKGEFQLGMSLFGIPFIIGTLLFGSLAVMSVCGKVVVSVDGDRGRIFTGVGPFGWNRRFSWRGVTAIQRTQKSANDGSTDQLTFEGEKRLNFASHLKSERLDFMRAALRKMLRESGR